MPGKIRKDILFYFIGTFFYFFSQWIITVFVVRLSGYVDAGYLSLAMSTSSTFEIIALFRVRDFQISDYRSEYSNDEYVGSRILTCFIAFFLCVFFSAVGKDRMQFLCISMFMLIRTAEALSDVFQGMEQKFNRYNYIAVSFFLRGIGMIGLFYILLYLKTGLHFVLLAIAIWSFAVVLICEWSRCNRIAAFRPMINARVMDLLKQCFPLMVSSFLISCINLVPKILLEKFYGAENLGIYSSIASPTLIVQVLAGTIIYPVIPKLTECLENDGRIAFLKVLHKLYSYILIMTIVIFIGAQLLGKIGLTILYGKDILEHYYLFTPIVFCTVILAVLRIFTQILTVFRKIGILTAVIVVTACMCVLISYPLVRLYGGNGASAAQIISCTISVGVLAIICEKICRTDAES